MRMSDEAVAKRAATRRNNRIKRALPLLADVIPQEWLTTPEEQLWRIQYQRGVARDWLDKMQERHAAYAAAVPIVRAWAYRLLSAQECEDAEYLVRVCTDYCAWGIWVKKLWQGVLPDAYGPTVYQSFRKFCGLEI
jgi:hypothetical protein